jgi:hypothetical protein
VFSVACSLLRVGQPCLPCAIMNGKDG